MSGYSNQISSAYNDTEIFKYLGLKDTNGNGVIEEKSFRTLWRNEGYKDEIDINKDRKLVGAEIRYYLNHVLKNPDENIKKKNPLTEEDRAQLSVLFAEIFKEKLEKAREIIEDLDGSGIYKFANPGMDESKKLVDIIIEMAKAKLFKLALKSAKLIPYPWDVSNAFAKIAHEMAKAGLFELSLKTTGSIEYAKDKAYAYKNIAAEMYKSDSKNPKISELFQLAIESAGSIEIQIEKYYAFRNITPEMVNCKVDETELVKAFQLSIYAATKNSESEYLFNQTIDDITKLGLTKKSLIKLFQTMPDAIKSITKDYYKNKAISKFMSTITKEGLDGSELSKLANLAVEAAKSIKGWIESASALCNIGFEMAQSGLLNKGIESIRTYGDAWVEAHALSWMASRLAREGYFKLAIETTKSMAGTEKKVDALAEIALAMGEAKKEKAKIKQLFILALKLLNKTYAIEVRARSDFEFAQYKEEKEVEIMIKMEKAGLKNEEIMEMFRKYIYKGNR
ncbi:hypothetical protein AMJ44_04035 [candidate division WOR-1 bacterium DG_54_3]|uniref:EF-hand domain-containing protein n=1 Tax=candidate division WOR-1 bacterium DG_54_3 TaxID=1703775 RepID=A0A0S7Y3K8_UNCSA|nr:MAG: hypothetical protein AMJ44_04035 [candidate division WOR-1 bacterium DG_54_3]